MNLPILNTATGITPVRKRHRTTIKEREHLEKGLEDMWSDPEIQEILLSTQETVDNSPPND